MLLNSVELNDILAQELQGFTIVGIEQSEEINRDGLPVLFLTVHYSGTGTSPSSTQVMNTLHRLVEKTGEHEAYPVLRLIRFDAPSLAAE